MKKKTSHLTKITMLHVSYSNDKQMEHIGSIALLATKVKFLSPNNTMGE